MFQFPESAHGGNSERMRCGIGQFFLHISLGLLWETALGVAEATLASPDFRFLSISRSFSSSVGGSVERSIVCRRNLGRNDDPPLRVRCSLRRTFFPYADYGSGEVKEDVLSSESDSEMGSPLAGKETSSCRPRLCLFSSRCHDRFRFFISLDSYPLVDFPAVVRLPLECSRSEPSFCRCCVTPYFLVR